MVEWRLFGSSRVQQRNPNITIPKQVVDGGLLESGSAAEWAIDHRFEQPVVMSKHPFAARGVELDRFTPLGNFDLRGDDKRMIRIPDELRGSSFETSSEQVPGDVTSFEPRQKRLFAIKSDAGETVVIALWTESGLRDRLAGGDTWVDKSANHRAVYECGLGDTLSIATAGNESQTHDLAEDQPLFTDLSELFEMCGRIDNEVRPATRQWDTPDLEDIVEKQYANLLTGTLLSYGMDSGAVFESLYDGTSRVMAPDDVSIGLHAHVADEMQRITFTTDRGSLTIEDPELFWDCHCSRPAGNFSTEQRPPTAEEHACPIHDTPKGDAVSEAFADAHCSIHYRGVEVVWKNTDNLWPPSVDAFKMYESLRSVGVFDQDIRSAVDVGCGTGFLGVAIAQQCASVEELYLTDWLLTPLVVTKLNWQRHLDTLDSRMPDARFRLGLGFQYTHHPNLVDREEPVDLCVCNPPYLPDLEEFSEVKIDHTVGGTDLLEAIITTGPTVADEVYVHFSDIAQSAAESAADEVGADLELIGSKSTIPFRVAPALSHPGYTDRLREYGLEERAEGRYKYWHDIGTYRVVT